MRKNTERLLDAWHQGRSDRGSESIWTDGENIWSYDTCILARQDENSPATNPYVLNMTKYSPTTSQHQNAIHETVPTHTGLAIVSGVMRGARPADLQSLVQA